MYITSNRKVIATVNNLSELDSYVLNSKCHTKPSNFISCKRIDYRSILTNNTISEIQLMKLINKQFSKDSKNRSVRSKGFWIIRGFSDFEAIQKVNDIQSKCAPSSKNYNGYEGMSDTKKSEHIKRHQSLAGKKGGDVIANNKEKRNTTIEFYISKGFSKSEAEAALSKRQSTFSKKHLTKKYGLSKANNIMDERNKKWMKSLKENNDIDEIIKSRTLWLTDKTKVKIASKKRLDTMVSNGKNLDPSLLNDYDYYWRLVWSYTRFQPLSNITGIEKRSADWHLDHIYSIKAGFMNNIPAYIIGNIHNLRIISAKANCSKKEGCHQTIDDILEKMKSDSN